MKIDDAKQLEQLLKMCHRQFVRSITIDGITIQLELQSPELKTEAAQDAKPVTEYTDEQLLTWSAN